MLTRISLLNLYNIPMNIQRLYRILLAKLRCNLYCIWQMFRYFRIFYEFTAYDQNNKLILIAATKDSLWNHFVKGESFSVEKVFYRET